MILNTTMETIMMSASPDPFSTSNISTTVLTTQIPTVCNTSLINNTCNGTDQHYPHSHYLDGVTLLTQIVCIIIIIAGVIGNLLVVLVFTSRWALLSSYEVFMVSLAVSDLLGTVVVPSTRLHDVSNGDFRGIGSVGCKIITFSSASSINVSSFTLIMISIDRFAAVKWPFKKRNHLCRFMITSTWVLGYGAAFVYLLGDRVRLWHNTQSDKYKCVFWGEVHQFAVITLVTFLLQNAVPLIVMTASSTLIVCELRKHNKSCLMDEAELYRRRNRTRKTMKLLIVVCVVFLICSTPINIYQLLYLFQSIGNISHEYMVLIHAILSMLMMTNSCINPIIYSKLHTSFRKRTLSMLRKLLLQPYRFATKRITSMYFARNRRMFRRKPIDRKRNTMTIEDEKDEDDFENTVHNQNCLDTIKKVSTFSTRTIDSRVSRSNSCLGNEYTKLMTPSESDIEEEDDVFLNLSAECLETYLEDIKETIL